MKFYTKERKLEKNPCFKDDQTEKSCVYNKYANDEQTVPNRFNSCMCAQNTFILTHSGTQRVHKQIGGRRETVKYQSFFFVYFDHFLLRQKQLCQHIYMRIVNWFNLCDLPIYAGTRGHVSVCAHRILGKKKRNN